MPNPPVRLLLARRWVIYVCLLVVACQGVRQTSARGSELRQTPIVRAFQHTRESVVNIRGEKTLGASTPESELDEPGRRVNGMGTGVVIDPRGYIVTNYHVVDGVRDIQVTLVDGARHIATVVGRDPETDLAVIKIATADKLPVIDAGRSDDLMIGESVIAVGNAYGYEHTVTRGIISALHRAVQVSDAQSYADLIQTDASINPGNSGGPLLNIDGQMIGINVAVRAGAQGIGFAIPVDKVIDVCSELLRARNVETSWHGMMLDGRMADDSRGRIIASIDSQSPARDAGLEPGDVLVKIGDQDILCPLDFHRAMLERKPGEKVSVSVRRGDETITRDLTFQKAPEQLVAPSASGWKLLGLRLKPIPADQFRKRYQSGYRGGLAVEAVRANSPAAGQGIHPGDVLVGMHVWETLSLENVSYILNRPEVQDLDPIKVYILRDGETLYSYLPLALKTAAKTQ